MVVICRSCYVVNDFQRAVKLPTAHSLYVVECNLHDCVDALLKLFPLLQQPALHFLKWAMQFYFYLLI